jgi:hypothetical protein
MGFCDLDLFQYKNEIRDIKLKGRHFITPPNPAKTPSILNTSPIPSASCQTRHSSRNVRSGGAFPHAG